MSRAPTKIGFVMTGRGDGAGGLMSKAFDYMMAEVGAKEALTFLTDVYDRHDAEEDDGDVSSDTVRRVFADVAGGKNLDEVDLETERMTALDFAAKSGFREFPQLLMNGVPVDKSSLGSSDELEEVIRTSDLSLQWTRLKSRMIIFALAVGARISTPLPLCIAGKAGYGTLLPPFLLVTNL